MAYRQKNFLNVIPRAWLEWDAMPHGGRWT